jgi:hypothetical protein
LNCDGRPSYLSRFARVGLCGSLGRQVGESRGGDCGRGWGRSIKAGKGGSRWLCAVNSDQSLGFSAFRRQHGSVARGVVVSRVIRVNPGESELSELSGWPRLSGLRMFEGWRGWVSVRPSAAPLVCDGRSPERHRPATSTSTAASVLRLRSAHLATCAPLRTTPVGEILRGCGRWGRLLLADFGWGEENVGRVFIYD